MKTILINVFDTAVAKNILTPQFLEELARAKDEVRAVVVVPDGKVTEFAREYDYPFLTFMARPRRFASKFEAAALFIARNSIPSQSVRQIQKRGLDGSGRLSLPRFLLARVLWLCGHAYGFRRFIKKALAPVFNIQVFEELLRTTDPDLVFATTIYSVDDIRLLRAAKRRGIRTLGMVKSWDNLTSKDVIFIPPDRLIVHNDIVKEEAVRLHGYPERNISVVGVPQFDWYADPRFPLGREEFFATLGLDSDKKLITYSAIGLWLVPHEREIIGMLDRIVNEGTIGVPVQLLVRMHPAYPDEKAALQKLFPRVAVDEPGSPVHDPGNVWKADWKFTTDDVRRLASTLKYSDVVVNCGSTMLLDAACFDTPTIGIASDDPSIVQKGRRFSRSLFARDHLHCVLKTGGVRLVWTEDELVKAVREYLADPSKDREGRQRIVREQAGVLGRAGRTLAEVMFDVLAKS